jgi:hypothetical protein
MGENGRLKMRQRIICAIIGGILIALPAPFFLFGLAFIVAAFFGRKSPGQSDDWRAKYRPG